MSAVSGLKFLYLAYFSKPIGQRLLYRLIRKNRIASIVEIGMGDMTAARRMISVAQRYQTDQDIRYTGIDLFEAATDRANTISLKTAHQQLKSTGAKINLVPGDPYSALARTANNLLQTDLLLISADVDQDSLSQAWFYIPRMLHAKSLVLKEERMAGKEETNYSQISRLQVERWAMLTSKQTVNRAA